MNHELDNLETFSRFLLGELPPEEEERMEIRLLEDAELQNLVGAAEFDLMDEYLRGGLSVADAARFETYFLNSPARRRDLELARIFPGPNAQPNTQNDHRESEENAPGNVIAFAPRRKPFAPSFRQAIRQPAFRIAAGLLCALGLGIVLWQVAWPAWQTREGMAALNEAYRKGRPIEARLSGFAHAPWEKDRGPGDERTDPLLRDRGSLTLLNVASEHPSAKTYRALGSTYLLKREIKEAIKYFEKSLQYDPNNALTHNDLGAALMESAQSKQQQLDREKDKTTPVAEQLSSEIFSDLSLANEHFSQALQLDAKLKDAIFNQALCLERLGLLDPALRNWEKYIELDPGGGWREEAQERIETLRKQKQKVTFDKDRIFREFLAASESGVEDDIWQAFLTGSQMRGNLITDRLLDEYLAMLSQGNRVEARTWLDLLTTAGRIEMEKNGDLYTRDLAFFYRRLRPQQAALHYLARQTYQSAIEKSRTSREEGLVLCQQARRRFAQAGNGIEIAMVELTMAAIHARTSDRESAMQIADKIEKYSNQKQYSWLQARSLYLMCGFQVDQNSFSRAISYCNRAFQKAKERQDQSLLAGVLSQSADAYWVLGFHDQAINYVRQFLKISSAHPIEMEKLWIAYSLSADVLSAVSHLYTSLLFEREALQVAIALDRPLQISRSHGFLSDIYEKLNQYPQAIEQAQKDFEIGRAHDDHRISQDIKAHALLRLGHLFRKTGKLTESLEAYDECVRISETEKKYYERLDAYRGRLRLHMQRGDHALARSELEQAIGQFERNRNQIDNDDLKTRFFETGHDIYNSGIELAVATDNDFRRAFLYSEQGRARSLRDMLQPVSKEPQRSPSHFSASLQQDISQILNRIPASAQIIQYSSLDESLFTWVLSNTELTGLRQNVRMEDLRAKVNEYLECIKDPQRDQKTALLSTELYDILIKPLENKLDPKKEIFVVTDKPLHLLPFGALTDPVNGKFLVEKYFISYSPSTLVFLHCTDAANRKISDTAERCLSVGESVFRQPDLINLSLPSTRKEAERVAMHYGANAELMLDNQATEPAVREKMKNVEVIHIATHGLVNERRPEYSSLALWQISDTASSDADGMLSAQEISLLNLPLIRLVVLSACQTFIGRDYKGEGMSGLARSFIGAGAPLVVASLWKVDSPMTAKFMDEFHARRTGSKMNTVEAICHTQRKMLKDESKDSRRPSAWAGFVSIGGYASY